MANQANPSLKWKLSWQLSIVFVLVVATVVVGLCVYGAMILSPTVGLKNKLFSALNESLILGPNGHLVVAEGPILRKFKESNERLWFVAATPDGSVASYGSIPRAYEEVSHYVNLMGHADLRGATNIDDVAAIDTVVTSVGEVRVMYGGNTSRSETFLVMLAKTYPIYVPLIAVSIPAIFFAVPRIVGRAIAGLSSVVRKAPEIDPRCAGARLPIDGVPKEVVPLILAFNGILDRLQSQLQARQRFLIDAAHELRTPIAIMQTRIEGMPVGYERNRLMADVGRLGETAEQLLDFERSNQDNELHKLVDVVEVTRQVVADLAPMAIAAGYEISFDSEIDKVDRVASPSGLPRAISNLVRNAIDHGGNAGLISISVSANGRVAISDQGPGITDEHQEQVFEPFYRITPRSKGAGLGLSLARQIISNHGGQITIESNSAGSTFAIHL